MAAADVFSNLTAGRFSQARAALVRLRQVDKEGRQTARLADAFRPRARTLWDEGRRGEARRYYQIVADLDDKDSVSRERAESKDEEKTTPIPVLPEQPVPPPELPKSVKKKGLAAAESASAPRPPGEEAAPRDRAASAKAAADGASALGRGDLVRAQIAFDRAVRADASNPDAIAGLAQVAFENARYIEALDYGRRAVRLQPRKAAYHVVVGDSYFKLLRYDQAQAAYQRALVLAPNDDGIKARIGRVRARLGE